ncbi:hypothetical protein CO731_01926 [Aminobacter sp. MSH1]|uniref:hypothetical protein n=1 Tax=unclassified Aminobacter TaxID=2644704 RepID=UPI000D505A1A|nr:MULTISPECIES: hypothetical protein [unclassified Aminobacter]AWC22462.1 hypothetical protein CO731_01926 [Aminobacter sp. MSH1]
MGINLTTIQRRLAMGAAAVVAVLLWVQADSVGLDETPWLIGVLVILALLFLAFAPKRETGKTFPASSTVSANSKNIAPASAFRAAYEIVEAEFMPVFEAAQLGLEKNTVTIMMADNVRLHAAKLAWIATALALEKAYPGFRKGHRFESLGLIAGVEFRKHLRSVPGMEGPEAKAKLLTMAAKETAECTFALDQTMARVSANQPIPMSPVFQRVEAGFPFAAMTRQQLAANDARLEAAYGPVFRKAVLAASAG